MHPRELRAKPLPTAVSLTVIEPCGARREKIRKAKKASRPRLQIFPPLLTVVVQTLEVEPSRRQELAADQAARTAFQISGAVLFLTRSLPSLN
jgi:hypothetical protein